MCEHKHTHKNCSFSGVRCATSDTLSLITEVHKHIAGGQDIVPGISFRLKTTQNVGDFAIYIRDTLNDSKQHTTLLYTDLQEHFLVLKEISTV